MATLFAFKAPSTLTIANGGTTSNVISFAEARGPVAILIIGPAALTAAVTLQVATTETGTFVPLQSGGSDITIPAAKGTQITMSTPGAMRLVSAGAEGAERVFGILGNSL